MIFLFGDHCANNPLVRGGLLGENNKPNSMVDYFYRLVTYIEIPPTSTPNVGRCKSKLEDNQQKQLEDDVTLVHEITDRSIGLL